MGGPDGRVRKEEAYHIPEALMLYASGILPDESGEIDLPVKSTDAVSTGVDCIAARELDHMVQEVRLMRIRAEPAMSDEDTDSEEDEEVLLDLAHRLCRAERRVSAIQVNPEPRDEVTAGLISEMKEALFK
jgi:hypothetical protein